jgi:Fur family transcriptional regulator, ferric uptake regulator
MASLEERCAQAGLKMTGQRKTILKVLEDAENHLSVEAVHERVRSIDSSISMATVYRTLNLLDELHLVTRHDFGENFARYDINLEHHHHLIDVESGQVIEFQNQEIEDMKKEIARKLGYDLVECRLELYGKKIRK